ncbi:MAG: nitroreductase family protein [Rikenellaceae bacterium]
MKTSWQTLTILLAVALVVLTIKITFLDAKGGGETAAVADPRQTVLDAIMTRTSVRSYNSEAVSNEDIETLLRAGMAAPTAGNRQPWEFVVITDRAVLDAIPEIIPASKMLRKAPLGIVVCGVPSQSFAPPLDEYWVQDCSAVTENILIAVNGMGLGAVWCGAYPNNKANRVEAMRELLNLPEGVTALNVIAIGHPDKEPVVKDKWKPEKVHYNRY